MHIQTPKLDVKERIQKVPYRYKVHLCVKQKIDIFLKRFILSLYSIFKDMIKNPSLS